jgi:hypothetical protein
MFICAILLTFVSVWVAFGALSAGYYAFRLRRTLPRLHELLRHTRGKRDLYPAILDTLEHKLSYLEGLGKNPVAETAVHILYGPRCVVELIHWERFILEAQAFHS